MHFNNLYLVHNECRIQLLLFFISKWNNKWRKIFTSSFHFELYTFLIVKLKRRCKLEKKVNDKKKYLQLFMTFESGIFIVPRKSSFVGF